MKVEELMTPEVQAVRADDRLDRAAALMWDHDCGCVPVIDWENRVIGMLTDRDACMAAYTRGQRLDEITVGSTMSSPPEVCHPGDRAEEAERLMQAYQVRRLPVIDDDGRLVGILSLNDLARAASQRGRRRDAVKVEDVEATLAAICQPHVPTHAPHGGSRA